MSRIEVFARKSSGLVRQATWFDGFLTSIGTMNMVWLGVSYIWALSLFPGAEFHYSIIIATVFCLFNALLFAQFATMMPRSGGDYVFNSRGITPAVGFIVNFSMVVWNLFWIAYTSYMLSAIYASSAFVTIGDILKIDWIVQLGEYAAQPLVSFIIGALAIVFTGFITYFGIRPFFRVMKIAFILGILGIIVMVGILLTSSHESFVKAFEIYFGEGAYNKVVTDAISSGWRPGISVDATILSIAVAFQPLGFSIWSSYISGEIKDANKFRINAYAMLGSLLTMGIFMLIVWWLSLNVFGYDFMGAIGYLYYNHPELSPIAIPPSTDYFTCIISQSPVLTILVGIGFIAWAFLYAPQSFLMVVRCMLAWSIDRLAPRKLSEVSSRYHTPVYAIIVTTVVSILFLGFFISTIYGYIPFDIFSIYGFNAFLGGGTLTFIAVSISGILLPLRRDVKRILELSPVNQKIGKIPLITINAIITLLFMSFITYLYLTIPEFGVSTVPSISFIVGIYALGIAWYAIVKGYQKRKGIPIEMAFKEIPPE